MAATSTLGKAKVSRSTTSTPGLLARAAAALRSTFIRWMHNYEVRRDLDRLDDHLLRDVGFDPRQARAEAERRFWETCTLGRTWDR